MGIKINCKYNDRGAWCTNKNIKRSLFGIGAKCCVIYDNYFSNFKCDYQEQYERPMIPQMKRYEIRKRKTN